MSKETRKKASRALPKDKFALVHLPSGEERQEPIVEVTKGALSIMLRVPRTELRPGTVLPRLRLFTSGECTLDGPATVREVAQQTLADGHVAFKLHLSFERKDTSLDDNATPHDSAQVILDALKNLTAGKVRALVESEPDGAPATFDKLTDNGTSFTLRVQRDVELSPGTTYRLIAELYGTRVVLEAAFMSRRGEECLFAGPTRLWTFRQRSLSRLRSLPESLSVTFDSPFTQERRERPVYDVSAGGLAFVTEPHDSLVVGVLLTELSLRLPTGVVRGRGLIRHLRENPQGQMVAGVELLGLDRDGARHLADFVAANVHPQVRWAQTSDLRHLWSVYAEAGLFARGPAALSPVVGRVDATRKALLHRGRELFMQVVGTSEGDLRGAAELLRTHENTFTLQHAGVAPAARLTLDQLVMPLIDEALRRKDVAYVRTLLWPTHAALARLREAVPDAEHIIWRELAAVREGTKYVAPSSLACDVREAGEDDLDWVANRLEKRLSPLEHAALDLGASELRLGKVESAYRGLGLSRRRLVRVAASVGGPLGVALVEQSAPGLNFLGLADAARIIALAPDAASRADAVSSLLHDAVKQQREAGRRGALLLVDTADQELALAAGCEFLGTLVEVIIAAKAARQVVNFLQLAS